jgi:hypothetical protein
VQEEVLEGDIVEGPAREGEEADAEARPLPERAPAGELDAWRGEVRTVAIAAAGGLAAGAATVAAINAVRTKAESRRQPRRIFRRGGKDQSILTSRSFLIDVHVLGR